MSVISLSLLTLTYYKLQYFHVNDGSLLPDILHDILEGVLQYKVKLMLQMMIGDYFKLENFNCRMEEFKLGYIKVKDRLLC